MNFDCPKFFFGVRNFLGVRYFFGVAGEGLKDEGFMLWFACVHLAVRVRESSTFMN